MKSGGSNNTVAQQTMQASQDVDIKATEVQQMRLIGYSGSALDAARTQYKAGRDVSSGKIGSRAAKVMEDKKELNMRSRVTPRVLVTLIICFRTDTGQIGDKL